MAKSRVAVRACSALRRALLYSRSDGGREQGRFWPFPRVEPPFPRSYRPSKSYAALPVSQNTGEPLHPALRYTRIRAAQWPDWSRPASRPASFLFINATETRGGVCYRPCRPRAPHGSGLVSGLILGFGVWAWVWFMAMVGASLGLGRRTRLKMDQVDQVALHECGCSAALHSRLSKDLYLPCRAIPYY